MHNDVMKEMGDVHSGADNASWNSSERPAPADTGRKHSHDDKRAAKQAGWLPNESTIGLMCSKPTILIPSILFYYNVLAIVSICQ
jgi:hypothetical protein